MKGIRYFVGLIKSEINISIELICSILFSVQILIMRVIETSIMVHYSPVKKIVNSLLWFGAGDPSKYW